MELTIIASVVVGGVAIFGGSGTVLGVALGTLALLVIQNGLELVRVSSFARHVSDRMATRRALARQDHDALRHASPP